MLANMKNVSRTALLVVLVVEIAVLAACQGGVEPIESEPSPTARSVTAGQATATPLSTPASTTVVTAQSAGEPVQDEDDVPYAALYKSVVAGDYHALRISDSGDAEYTNHSRTYAITTHRRGNLSPEQTRALFALLASKGFFTLEEEYSLPPPSEGDPLEDVEDVYYWVEGFDGQEENAVLTDEYASPAELDGIIRTLFDAVIQLPEVPVAGASLLAVDNRILPYLRVEEGMVRLELDEQNAEEYPSLQDALAASCSIVQIENQIGSKEMQLFTAETHMMEVSSGDRQFVVLLLHTE